jgi:hypothetical protein
MNYIPNTPETRGKIYPIESHAPDNDCPVLVAMIDKFGDLIPTPIPGRFVHPVNLGPSAQFVTTTGEVHRPHASQCISVERKDFPFQAVAMVGWAFYPKIGDVFSFGPIPSIPKPRELYVSVAEKWLSESPYSITDAVKAMLLLVIEGQESSFRDEFCSYMRPQDIENIINTPIFDKYGESTLRLRGYLSAFIDGRLIAACGSKEAFLGSTMQELFNIVIFP